MSSLQVKACLLNRSYITDEQTFKKQLNIEINHKSYFMFNTMTVGSFHFFPIGNRKWRIYREYLVAFLRKCRAILALYRHSITAEEKLKIQRSWKLAMNLTCSFSQRNRYLVYFLFLSQYEYTTVRIRKVLVFEVIIALTISKTTRDERIESVSRTPQGLIAIGVIRDDRTNELVFPKRHKRSRRRCNKQIKRGPPGVERSSGILKRVRA